MTRPTSTPDPTPRYLAEPLGRFLERVAAPGPGPTAGAAAAVAGALAAALAELSARLARRQRPDAPALAERAAALTDRLTNLSAADVAAVGRIIDADRGAANGSDGQVGGPGSPPDEPETTTIPVAIAEAAADAAVLAADLAADGNPRLRGDAVTAALLADAAARSCVVLVGLNVAGSTGEPDGDEPGPLAAVRVHAFHATAAARAALANLPETVAPEDP